MKKVKGTKKDTRTILTGWQAGERVTVYVGKKAGLKALIVSLEAKAQDI
jgi:hypothetical protein